MTKHLSNNDDSQVSSRPYDGVGTNADNPDWGATGTELLRLAPSENGEDAEMSGADRPNAREISNAVSQQFENTTNAAGASDFLWIWGQFLDHDLSLTEGGTTVSANIEVPTGDPFFDPFNTGEVEITFNRVDEHNGGYANEITAFIDASMIYGSEAEMVEAMRTDDGKLIMTEDAQLELEGATLLTGDVRAAENIALSVMHTIFTREHNRIVDELATASPEMSADELFTTARAHVEAIVQAITFNTFLPVLVGEDQFEAYTGYDATVNPGVSVEFSTAVYRLGHTLLSSNLQLVSEDGQQTDQLALRDAFFQPGLLTDADLIEDLLRGSATQTAQAVDTMVVEDVRSFLFGPPGAGGFDLAALNIQRGRDLGVASYNNLRDALGLERAETFSDITSDSDLAARLESVYGSVDLVDAWIGGLAEDPVHGALLGEMFSLVMIDQFTRLRDGDAFWSEGGEILSQDAVAQLWDTTLSDVILRNTDVEAIQSNVFIAMDRHIGDDGKNRLIGDGDADFLFGGGGADTLIGRGGLDELQGGDGNDRLVGGQGDDLLFGDDGRDRLIGGAGEDFLSGGDGSDRLFGRAGDDRLTGDDGRDFLKGGAGDDTLTGGDGRDVFHFDARWGGNDTITDFEFGVDTVLISNLRRSKIDIVETHDGDVVLSMKHGGSLTFEGLAGSFDPDIWGGHFC